VIQKIVTGDQYPDELKETSRQNIQSMGMVNKEHMKRSAKELLAIATYDEEGQSIMSIFATVPEIYTNNPEAVHEKIGDIFKMKFNIM
jgi:hypothetical protein